MANFIHYLILIPLIIIVYQDFKQRSISWWTIPLLLVIGGIQSYSANYWQQGFQFLFSQYLIYWFSIFSADRFIFFTERKNSWFKSLIDG